VRKDEKKTREKRKKMSTKQRRQNRRFSAESAARRGCGTINRYGQLLESTSRVQFATPRQRAARWTRVLAGRKRDRETKSRRGKRKGERDYPDIHHTLFFILHYPCSTPLYSIMPAPRINDESYSPPPPPDANRHMSIRLLVVLAVCNSDKH